MATRTLRQGRRRAPPLRTKALRSTLFVGALAMVAAAVALLAGLNLSPTRAAFAAATDDEPLAAPAQRLSITDLGTLHGGDYSVATGINDRGQVVGEGSTAFGGHAFLWEKGKMRALGTLHSECCSLAFGINNRGQVVGESNTASGSANAALWTK